MLPFIVIFFGPFVLSTPIPAGVYINKNGDVGASWNGYSASAGLGGLLNGGPQGGLHAEAGTPGGQFAAAGLGGTVGSGKPQGGLLAIAGTPGHVASAGSQSASASSVVFGPPPPPPPPLVGPGPLPHRGTIFDDIFNIPQSVLGAVNQFLNVKKAGVPPSSQAQLHKVPEGNSACPSACTTNANANASAAAAAATASTGSETSAQHQPSKPHPHPPGPTKYDAIFAIPQSVLGAVNNFLNRL